MEPQAQWIYRHTRLDDTELSAARVQSKADDDWVLRLGARIKGRFATGTGVFQPYVRANVYKSARTDDVSGFIVPSARTDIHASGGSTGTELALGATLLQPHGISLYGELGRLWAHGGASRVSSQLRLDVGVKVGW
ncbi:Autotransporter beta-domain protein [compost metagenome]